MRRLVRIKIADDNDLEQARVALVTTMTFFKRLQAEAAKVSSSRTSYPLVDHNLSHIIPSRTYLTSRTMHHHHHHLLPRLFGIMTPPFSPTHTHTHLPQSLLLFLGTSLCCVVLLCLSGQHHSVRIVHAARLTNRSTDNTGLRDQQYIAWSLQLFVFLFFKFYYSYVFCLIYFSL